MLPTRAVLPAENRRISWSELQHRLIKQFAPSSVVVTGDRDIAHMSDSAGRFLQFTGGQPATNPLRLVRPDLRIELRDPFPRRADRRICRGLPHSVDLGGERILVHLHGKPAKELAPDFLLIGIRPSRPAHLETARDAAPARLTRRFFPSRTIPPGKPMNTETTLITGASSGIGLHLAHEFARHGHPLVLVAPVEAELREIAEHMRSEHEVDATVIAANLEHPDAPRAVFDALGQAGIPVEILVNNAGKGFHGKWWERSLEEDLSMVRLNIEAVLRLTKLFLPPMLARRRGRILNVASVAGFLPGPLLATYAATKAFVLSWSEALAVELDDTPISVTALCPGATDTDFFEKADAENIRARQSHNVMSPQEVARIGYEALMKGELFTVCGAENKAMIAARRILPVRTAAKMNEMQHSDVPPEQRTRHRGDAEGPAAEEDEALPGAAH